MRPLRGELSGVVLRLQGVRKSFGENRVLDGLDLEVERGETVAVVGRSGAGKSVLLKQIAGLQRPDAGEVWVEDRNLGVASRREVEEVRLRIGYVFQFAALFDSMTVGENIRMALRRHALSRAEMEKRVDETLRRVDLEGSASSYPAELSGGMRKRAGVARAVAADPEILLYDEPTSGLDPVTTAMMDELMLKMKDELRATSVVVTHDLQSAYRVADRVAMLFGGRIRYVGTPEEFREAGDAAVRSFVEGRQDLWPEE